MTFEEMFGKMEEYVAQTDVSGIREHLAYQFNITGEGAGTFYIEVNQGALTIRPYDYRDRDALFTCSADTLFKLAEGKADPIPAVMLGRLKVEGNIDKALKLKEFLGKKK